MTIEFDNDEAFGRITVNDKFARGFLAEHRIVCASSPHYRANAFNKPRHPQT